MGVMLHFVPVRWMFAVLLAVVFVATPSSAAYRGDEGRARLSNDSWLWSTGDFHPDGGRPDAQPIKRNPEGERDTA
ncbi:MAG TPA: hypothetical protein VL742_15375 [Casimicrobiaceae bacterium]|nr:hypothetical protein [Casimicrobiaceae bacterium]